MARKQLKAVQAGSLDATRLAGSSDSDAVSPRERGPEAALPADRVYLALRSAILDGKVAAGTRLVEESTARKLGVSRTPVREAIFRLKSEGLVERDSRGGAVVAGLSPEEIEDVYAVRSALEGLTARLAVRSMLPRDHVRLEHVQGKLEGATAAKRFEELATLNLHFHDVILRSTRNPTLIAFMAQIHDSLRRVKLTTLSYPGRAPEAMKEHRALIAALKAGNPQQAERIARQHIDNALGIRLLINLSEELLGLDEAES